MLQVVIVEDELHSRETLRNLLTEFCAQVEIVAMAATLSEGVHAIKTNRPDLVFLDIELQPHTGFDLLEQVANQNFHLIFTTAYEHYALKAIKFSAIDYLLKPIDVEELIDAIEKVQKIRDEEMHNKRVEVLLNNMQNMNNTQHTITLSTMEGMEFVCVADIVRCEAMGAYTHFILRNGKKILVSKHLKEYENLLADHRFFRIHQSHLINLTEVARFVKPDEQVVLKNGDVIKVAHNRKENFLSMMKTFT